MPVYTYHAKKSSGKVIRGSLEAQTREEAIAMLDASGLFLLAFEEKKSAAEHSRIRRISRKHLLSFTHQLSTLVNSGSPLLTSLITLTTQTEQAALKPVLTDIVAQVRDGHDFSHALKNYPRIFDQLYISLVRIGETSGTLGENLRRMAEFLDEDLDLKANITSVLLYPALVLAVGVATIVTLLKFVIPKIAGIFQEIGQALPLPTLMLIKFSSFFSKYGFFIAAIFLGATIGIRRYLAGAKERLWWDRMLLGVPVTGRLLEKVETCRLARTLHTLLSNGVSMDVALETATQTIGNTFLRTQIRSVEERIKEGSSLAEAMKNAGIFTPAFINVVTVGEDSGQLATVLITLAQDYTKEINRAIKRLVSLCEPVLILGVGLIVGFVVLSMLLPIFQIDFNL